jgi:hypothetical protein
MGILNHDSSGWRSGRGARFCGVVVPPHGPRLTLSAGFQPTSTNQTSTDKKL